MTSLFGCDGVEFPKVCGDYQIAHNDITVRVACLSCYSVRSSVKFNYCKQQPGSGNFNTHETLLQKYFFIKTYTTINSKKTEWKKTFKQSLYRYATIL